MFTEQLPALRTDIEQLISNLAFEDAKAEWHAQDESLEGATDQVRIDLP